MNRSVIFFYCLLFCTLLYAGQEELPARQYWNFEEICTLDNADYWTGPFDQDDISVSEDKVEGAGSIKVKINVEPGHFIRIEKNFVCDCHDGFRNMMAFGMVDEDFSPYNSMSFYFKSDIANIEKIIFRIFDREGGWIEWPVKLDGDIKSWTKYTLSFPDKLWPMFNERRTGGFIWEIHAGDENVSGNVWLDDVDLSSECADGIEGKVFEQGKVGHNTKINPLPVKDKYSDKQFHLVMNMTGEIGISMYELDSDEAIKRLSQAVAVFKDVRDLEYFFMPEAWRIKRDSPGRDKWLKDSQKVYEDMARWCEENKVPFYAGIAQSDAALVTTPQTVKACIEAAPNMCKGAMMGEFSIESNGGIDEVVEILETLKKHDLKLLYFQQSDYWFKIMLPHGDEFRDRIMVKYPDVFVPMWENLLPAGQGLAWASMLGMWRGGLCQDWGVSAQSWGYANMNWGGTSDQPGNMWLRMFLSVASSGGRYIEIEPKWAFDGENVPGQVEHFKQWAHNLRWVGRRRAQVDIDLDPSGPMRALHLFNRLVCSGAITAAQDAEKVVSMSPVVFKVKHTDDWGKWGFFHKAVDKTVYDGCCPNYNEMSAQVPSWDPFSYLYGSNHFYDQTFPLTDYGLVNILPAYADIDFATAVFQTDGNVVFHEGEKYSPEKAMPIIKKQFELAAEILPFQAKGCTWTAVEVGKGDYLITMLDPNDRFPKGVDTVLKINLNAQYMVYDGLTSEKKQVKGNSVDVSIEPGSFRLIRVIKAEKH